MIPIHPRRLPSLLILLVTTLAMAAPAALTRGELPEVLPFRQRAALRDAWLTRRLDTLVPRLMGEQGIDMWILVGREYNEDPVLATMLPARWIGARRRTVLVFHDRGGEAGVERLAVARYAVGEAFPGAWDPATQPDQWAALAALVAERDPRRIALDVSPTFALADGLSHTEHRALMAALGPELSSRVVSAEALCIGWLELRLPEEQELYPTLCALAHGLIAEGFSDRVVTPGVTTTEDVQWWFRERIAALALDTWFHPDVSLQRAGDDEHDGDFSAHDRGTVIHPGDLLHVDIGITYLGLNTDTQQHAYVLRPGESEPPAGLVAGLAAGNRLQDILTDAFVPGRTGNEVLAAALERAREEGLRPTIYTHPLGLHGHGAGATIGLWDRQDGVPGRGDWPLRTDTVWSIELNTAVDIPEWDGKTVRIMLEEDALFGDGGVRYLDGRQTELLLIGNPDQRPR